MYTIQSHTTTRMESGNLESECLFQYASHSIQPNSKGMLGHFDCQSLRFMLQCGTATASVGDR